MIDLLREIRSLINEFEPFPAKITPPDDGHVLLLANDDLRQCTHYRVEQKERQFKAAGLPIKIVSHKHLEDFYKALIGARAVIFYRVAAFPSVIRAIDTARSLGLPTYYEIDDFLFSPHHYPDTYASYQNQISVEEYADLRWGVQLFHFAMIMCDYGISSTSPLAEEIRKVVVSNRCIVLPNGLDQRNEPAIQLAATRPKEKSSVVIFYGSGTKAHNEDFTILASNALLRALKHHHNVKLMVVGHLALGPEFEIYSDRIIRIPFIANIDQYWSLLSTCDINLAPLLPSVMSGCKSEIKWLEAGAFAIPSIVSNTATYLDVTEHNVDCLVASSPAGSGPRISRR